MRAHAITDTIATAMHAAHRGAPPAWRLTMPAGEPVGVVLALHGGGWKMVGEATLPSMHDVVERWAARGWAVLNADYRAGGASIDDALASWDALRAAAGPGLPGVIAGKSAGGHLGLLTAAARRDVAAVVAESAPSDLARMGGFPDADKVRALAVEAFGSHSGGLAAASPAHPDVAARIDARLLLAASAADQVVPPDQTLRMAAARPGSQTTAMILEPGPREFIHAGVSDAAFARFVAAEDALERSIRLTSE
jgi:dipeptidyl aminopeptidase/acylaminoacyl peptidase